MVLQRGRHRPAGEVTRGVTAPNRLRRVDRWITATHGWQLGVAGQAPLVVDLGFGVSPVTTVELYERLRRMRRDVRVVGLEIDPERVEEGRRFLSERARYERYPGLTFGLGGFELPVTRPPLLVRAMNVLRQYEEEEAWWAWDRLCAGLAPNGVLVEGTCDEIGRLCVWVTLSCSRTGEPPFWRTDGVGQAKPRTITFAAHLPGLSRPSVLAERLPKTLIHRNVPGEPIHRFFRDFDRSWAITTQRSVFGPRQHWIAAVEHLSGIWPVMRRPPAGGRPRWRLGEVTLPWEAIAPCPR